MKSLSSWSQPFSPPNHVSHLEWEPRVTVCFFFSLSHRMSYIPYFSCRASQWPPFSEPAHLSSRALQSSTQCWQAGWSWSRDHSIAPQLGTYHTYWHMVDHDVGLKVGKIILEKSLPPWDFGNTKPCPSSHLSWSLWCSDSLYWTHARQLTCQAFFTYLSRIV